MKMVYLHLGLVLLLAGCDESDPHMAKQEKYRTYEPSEFFSDGASARPLVFGVVARDEPVPKPPSDQLRIDEQSVKAGQESFEIYCAACHGRLANGEGIVVQRGLTRPPSFHIQRLKDESDQHFYDVMSNGYGAMFSYNDRIAPLERWQIVAYIRVLQSAPDLADHPLSAQDRQALLAGGEGQRLAKGGGQ